ncbi:hypothetical protein BU23DRAFT_630290 [Bimuria novae-zelandiae CBS 107.79]|uniref:Uncharacterized protein n=1 Tax=Bimuria novae-zelandiae CBS 107.79 TaxID=1447943 RepID=A0A6A5VT76_9PLEO|nr:hypothetical protein BU23DRAFT_630290 [Bimuria novae-zelandiae CBS 107.79]
MTDTPTPTLTSSLITDSSVIRGWNRGPISTYFAPPSSCTATLTLQQTLTPAPDYGNLFAAHWFDPYLDSSCHPAGSLTQDGGLNSAGWEDYYYSPAVCPQGWKTGSQYTSSVRARDGDGFFRYATLGPQVTAAVCCPSGWEHNEQYGHLCVSPLTRDQVVRYWHPTNKGANGYDRGWVSTSTLASKSSVLADGFQVWWHSSDLEMLASATNAPVSPTFSTPVSPTFSTPVSPIFSTPASQTSSQSTSGSTLSPSEDNTGGLSQGAKIGIGVGVSLVAVIGLAALLLVLRNRRKKSRAGAPVALSQTTEYVNLESVKYAHQD